MVVTTGSLLSDIVAKNEEEIINIKNQRIFAIQDKLSKYYEMFGDCSDNADVKRLKREMYILIEERLDDLSRDDWSEKDLLEIYDEQMKFLEKARLEKELTKCQDKLYNHIWLHGLNKDSDALKQIEDEYDKIDKKLKELSS